MSPEGRTDARGNNKIVFGRPLPHVCNAVYDTIIVYTSIGTFFATEDLP